MIRLPDFDILRESWGRSAVEEYLFTLVNLLSTFVLRYPGALLARYFRSDFAVLLPHSSLKEAEGIANQLLKSVDSLPTTHMTAELLVNMTPSETRVAYIDGGILQEIHIERDARRGIVGNIYKGRISRVLPGMQAAFVDIGLEKAAFLHASDIMPHTECVAGDEQKNFTVRDISQLVRQGQDLMVQVVKDPLGTKGARLTTDITLPSRYLVFMPGASHVGVSQRIESEEERERLKRIVADYCDDQGGFIIRTAAEGVRDNALAADAAYLKRVWNKVME